MDDTCSLCETLWEGESYGVLICQHSRVVCLTCREMMKCDEHPLTLTMPCGQALESEIPHQGIDIGGLADLDCDSTEVIDRR